MKPLAVLIDHLAEDLARLWEMKPWIRGWGPDCEVLEPEALRQEIAEEMVAATEIYREKAGEIR